VSAGCRHYRFPTPFGPVALIWTLSGEELRIVRLLLPRPARPAAEQLRAGYPDSRPEAPPAIRALASRLQRFLEGEAIGLPLETLALERCTPFQRRVLITEHRIPRGRVSSYGALAEAVGRPGAARAVGRALARNPFPLFIPCHRAITSAGRLGGYQGGTAMKRELLRYEGVRFSPAGRLLDPGARYRPPRMLDRAAARSSNHKSGNR
jgi:methylated-DNA-[protein]-cysteine S-methyltransferase